MEACSIQRPTEAHSHTNDSCPLCLWVCIELYLYVLQCRIRSLLLLTHSQRGPRVFREPSNFSTESARMDHDSS